jgi:site-specific recombinase XerD
MFHQLNANHISRKFNSYLKIANLSQFKLHSLRHTFATNLIHLGVDVYTVSRLLGHSDIRTTLIYAKMKVDVMKEAVNRLTPDPVDLPVEKISS